MSKLTRRIIESHSSYVETQNISHSRVPPPDCISPNPSHTTFSDLKRVAEFTLSTPTSNEEINKRLNSQNLSELKLGGLQFLIYKSILLSLYLAYACFRYFQYQYNRIRIKVFNFAYSPSNAPQLIRQDVLKLSKLPKRLSSILEYKSEGEVGGGISGLINDGSNLVCWTVSAGISHLSLYDYDGLLKRNVHKFRKAIHETLAKYYGPTNVPNFSVRVPHLNTVYCNFQESDVKNEKDKTQNENVAIEISLLSVRDGRETIVDLTKAMADLCRAGDLKLEDITMKLVDTELTELVGEEPDLLLYFGPHLDLQGYPPWHIRLTEFYWEEDNDDVMYSVFIRGLIQYSTCKINIGK